MAADLAAGAVHGRELDAVVQAAELGAALRLARLEALRLVDL